MKITKNGEKDKPELDSLFSARKVYLRVRSKENVEKKHEKYWVKKHIWNDEEKIFELLLGDLEICTKAEN